MVYRYSWNYVSLLWSANHRLRKNIQQKTIRRLRVHDYLYLIWGEIVLEIAISRIGLKPIGWLTQIRKLFPISLQARKKRVISIWIRPTLQTKKIRKAVNFFLLQGDKFISENGKAVLILKSFLSNVVKNFKLLNLKLTHLGEKKRHVPLKEIVC